ncbi:MAG: hypothetical protein IKJ30_06655 [Bacilli bacterium]|nr:hypothetical protein [Bacilli bacterium]
MDNVIQKDDVVVLSDNKSYSVLRVFEYEGDSYVVFLQRTDYDEKNPVVLFARERVDDEKVSVDIILDEDFIRELSAHLQSISDDNE